MSDNAEQRPKNDSEEISVDHARQQIVTKYINYERLKLIYSN